MYAFVTLAFLTMIAAAWHTVDAAQMNGVVQSSAAQAQAQALNMAAYRQSVIHYLQSADPSFQGSIPADQLGSASQTASWNNYVEGGTIVIYPKSATPGSLPSFMSQVAQGSILAGVARGGFLVPSSQPGLAIPLPAGIAHSLPDGTPVWMASVTRGQQS